MKLPVRYLALLPALAPMLAAADGEAYRYYLAGNPGDVRTETRGLIVMQGGGDDVDENYRRMGEFAGGGDFVVLRASRADEYNDYVLALCGCDSVETIVFEAREAAFDDFVVETIREAEALFIAGGDQSRYVRFFKDTPVETAINELAARPAPIGGTSAGMAILGEFAYSAMSSASATSAAALADPYMADVTLERSFLRLPMLAGILTDQHLLERDRLGRTIVFLARLLADGWTDRGRAIAADRETALHIDPATGLATVYATDTHETPYVWFVEARNRPEVCRPGVPLTFGGITVQRLGPGGRFDLGSWHSRDAERYELEVTDGAVSSTRGSAYGP
ncbi:MAG: cyanophycinase [Woeseiaceae bacterium]|nr:cyanophycinase [Woeseiaceae bacterium]